MKIGVFGKNNPLTFLINDMNNIVHQKVNYIKNNINHRVNSTIRSYPRRTCTYTETRLRVSLLCVT